MQRIPRLYVLAVLFSFAGLAGGRVDPGTPSFSAYDRGQYDTINLQNLNVSLNVPIMSKAGAFPFRFYATGAQSYVANTSGAIDPGILVVTTGLNFAANTSLGPLTSLNNIAFYSSTASVTCPSGDGTGTATKYSGWFIVFADGTQHSLPSTDASYYGTSCSGSFTDQVVDGTGYTVSVTGTTLNSVYTSGGVSLTGSSVTDRNGNQISYSGGYGSATWTDTLGLTVLTQASSGLSWNWTDVNGGSPTASLTMTSYTVTTSSARSARPRPARTRSRCRMSTMGWGG